MPSPGSTEGRRPGVATWVQSAWVLGRQKWEKKNVKDHDRRSKLIQSHMGILPIFQNFFTLKWSPQIISNFLHQNGHIKHFFKLFNPKWSPKIFSKILH
jgi:hypothetical protein